MTKLKFSYIVFIIMGGVGLLVMLYLIKKNSDLIESITEIEKDKSYNIQVKKAFNERGTYIMNNKYFIASYTDIISNDYGYAKDNAIWRPKDAKFIPSISDISAPFRLYKDANNDTIKIEKGNKTILLLMSDE